MVNTAEAHAGRLARFFQRDSGPACAIDFYTLQPAPTQWVAVGRPVTTDGRRPLLVGTGTTEEAAVLDLRGRCPHGEPAMHVLMRREPEDRLL
jgi:hypothetical protein